jgi:peptidoglycan/xylan/chitin deacetylase (PgdA/CDA1 family)
MKFPSILAVLVLLGTSASGREPVPDRLVVLTFDDSSKSYYTVARPILKKHKFGATFFITEGFDFPTNKKDYMSWDEIAQLHKDGFEIGNHTLDHKGVSEKTIRDLSAQVKGIQSRCKEHGIPSPVSFAYPGNAIAPEALPVLKELGIQFARRGGSPEYRYEKGRGFAYEPGVDHPLLIPSAGDARPTWTLDDFKSAVHQARDGKIAVLQFHGVPDTAHEWVNTRKEQFEAYMQYLADEKFTVIEMRDLARYVDAETVPANPFGIIESRKRLVDERAGSVVEKPRLVVLTDIGGDPDDQQSMIRLMHYANEFDIEGLIASAAGTPGELKKETVRPELIREIVEAYGKVRPNLLLHRPDFPDAKVLLARIKSGNPVRGIKSLGEGHDTEGSRWIIAVVDRDDPRPVNVAIWGGSTELAQALWRVRNDRTPEQLRKFLGKLRVFSIGHQDDTGPWIRENFPDLFGIVSIAAKGQDMRRGAYRGMYLGGDESLTSREWVERNLRKERGPLGALYPTSTWTAPNSHSTLKEGDTPSWFYFLPNGLGDPAHPEWGSWGGRFRKEKGGLYLDDKDTVGEITDSRASVWRWRPAFQADLAARAEWCVKPVKNSNHPPVPVLNGDRSLAAVRVRAKPGATVMLSATGSNDSDGDRLTFNWFVYAEAGSYGKPVPINDPDKDSISLTIPSDAAGKSIHVILAVTDTGKPALTRYRRAVIDASETSGEPPPTRNKKN